MTQFRPVVFLAALFIVGGPLTASPQTEQTRIPEPDNASAIRDGGFLGKLAGEWILSRKIGGKMAENKATANWVLNNQFLQLHMIDAASPPQYEAVVLIGYDESTKEYVAHWADTFGAQYAAIGRGRLANDSIEFKFTYPDGPFFNTFSWHASDGTWTSYMENVMPDGSRGFFAEDVYHRPGQ